MSVDIISTLAYGKKLVPNPLKTRLKHNNFNTLDYQLLKMIYSESAENFASGSI